MNGPGCHTSHHSSARDLTAGCTSGHGICGNSRLSLRSLVATLSFMGSGALATYLSGTTAVFGIPPGIAPLMGPVGASPAAKLGIGLLVLAVLAMWVLGAAGRFLTSPRCAPTPAALQKELQGAEVGMLYHLLFYLHSSVVNLVQCYLSLCASGQ